MNDDIVERLRFQRTNSVLCAEAADEIERLRAEKEHWFHLARRLFDLIPETSSEALHRANVLRLCEESLHNEFEKGLSHD